MNNFSLRKAAIEDVDQLKELYHGTIIHVNSKDYNEVQIKAWAATAFKTYSLIERINDQHFFEAENPNNIITGFASIDDTGYLDLMYVHKDFQRKGVASLLMNKMLEIARALNVGSIESEVSITAKPLFEKFGFKITEEQTVKIDTVELKNYKMTLIYS